MREFIWGLVVGVILMGLISFIGGANYVEGISQEYKDSINTVRALNALKLDSLNLVLDSLSQDSVRIEEKLIYLDTNEKNLLHSVDTMRDSSLIRAIRSTLYY